MVYSVASTAVVRPPQPYAFHVISEKWLFQKGIAIVAQHGKEGTNREGGDDISNFIFDELGYSDGKQIVCH